MRSPAPAGVLLASVLLAAAVPGAAAATGRPTRPGPVVQPRQSVTLVLTPRDRYGLRALATRPVHRGPAAHRLAPLLPGADRSAAVRREVRRLGLTVRASSPLTVTATGPAGLVRALFGSARSSPGVHAAALPALPPSLLGAVTVAFGGDETRPAFSRAATAEQLRTAYGVAPRPAATPGKGSATVATVQLSDWDRTDLDAYAANRPAGTPAPSLTEVRDLDEPPTRVTRRGPGFGDDVEVALDQEVMYAVAPSVRQRVYLSANSLSGTYDSFVHVAFDALRTDTAADRHLTSVSYSWGICESEVLDEPDVVDAFEDLFAFVTSTGVTVFAASGDDGALCRSNDGKGPVDRPATPSYPASSPQVVAVGGTSFSSPDGAGQVGWSVRDERLPFVGASGGGESLLFPRPAYQDSSTSSRRRVVPDIAALAGAPGFAIVTSSPAVPPVSRRPHSLVVYGTSLAAPLSAALYTEALRSRGYRWGIGSLHEGLYGAADSPAYLDITAGASNGYDSPRPGYDGVTGLGAPRWDTLLPQLGGDPHLSTATFYLRSPLVAVAVRQPPWQLFEHFRIRDTDGGEPSCTYAGSTEQPPTVVDLRDRRGRVDQGEHDLALLAIDARGRCHTAHTSVFLDSVRPTVSGSLRLRGDGRTVTATWATDDGEPSSGGLRVTAVVRDLSRGVPILRVARTARRSASFRGVPGHSYLLSTSVTDAAGNTRSRLRAALLTVPRRR